MELTNMGIHGRRFAQFMRAKLRERKATRDGYKDVDLARELGIPYETLKGWLKKDTVERIDLDNYYAVEDLFGDEFRLYMREKE